MSFERTGLALQNPDIQRAAAAALAVVPRDEVLAALPRASRSVVKGNKGKGGGGGGSKDMLK